MGVPNATSSEIVLECMRQKVRKGKGMDWKFDSFKKMLFLLAISLSCYSK